MKTIKHSIQKINNIKRVDLMLIKDGNYIIKVDKFNSEGYYLPSESFNIAEFTELTNAICYYNEILESTNKLQVIL